MGTHQHLARSIIPIREQGDSSRRGAGPPADRPQIPIAALAANAAKVDGVKISLLDKDMEIAMRRRLAKGVRMYKGDD